MRVIHQSQLTEEFDGTLPYDNSEWIEIRMVGMAAYAVQDQFLRYHYDIYLNSLAVGMAWIVTATVTTAFKITPILLDGWYITELNSGAVSSVSQAEQMHIKTYLLQCNP